MMVLYFSSDSSVNAAGYKVEVTAQGHSYSDTDTSDRVLVFPAANLTLPDGRAGTPGIPLLVASPLYTVEARAFIYSRSYTLKTSVPVRSLIIERPPLPISVLPLVGRRFSFVAATSPPVGAQVEPSSAIGGPALIPSGGVGILSLSYSPLPTGVDFEIEVRTQKLSQSAMRVTILDGVAIATGPFPGPGARLVPPSRTVRAARLAPRIQPIVDLLGYLLPRRQGARRAGAHRVRQRRHLRWGWLHPFVAVVHVLHRGGRNWPRYRAHRRLVLPLRFGFGQRMRHCAFPR